MDEKYLETADALTSSMIEQRITEARRKAPKPVDFAGFCTCGAEVPEVRISHGFFNCIDCQVLIERKSKGRA